MGSKVISISQFNRIQPVELSTETNLVTQKFQKEEVEANEMLLDVLLKLREGRVPVAKKMFHKITADRSELDFKYKAGLKDLHTESGEDDGLNFDDNILKTERVICGIIHNQKPFSKTEARKFFTGLERALKG